MSKDNGLAFFFTSIGGFFSSLIHKPILTLFIMPGIHWENAIDFGMNAIISGGIGMGFKMFYDKFLANKQEK